jgi:hypothetical protein
MEPAASGRTQLHISSIRSEEQEQKWKRGGPGGAASPKSGGLPKACVGPSIPQLTLKLQVVTMPRSLLALPA